ncbi:conjugal transfer protein TrbG [Caulobacter vibrioides]|nr:conjugal transfer protein TrbG [Caulobacter vibrioides]
MLLCTLAADAVSAQTPARPVPYSALAVGRDAQVAQANAAARVEPSRDGFIGATQRYAWTEGGLYQVYAAPGHVTDIVLQAGETLSETGPVAAGDTARWIIGDTQSGAGEARQVHVLIKPIARDLVTNMVINTNRRTYHLELRATPANYMAAVSWTYPQDELLAIKAQAAKAQAQAAATVASSVDVAALNFAYRIDGDRPAWRPERVFDDGRQVFIALPAAVRQGELPPLFMLDPAGGAALVNYRVKDGYLIVDQLFEAAELRLGDKKRQQAVRITRRAGAPSR